MKTVMFSKHQFIVATIKPWNIENYKKYFSKRKNFHLIDQQDDLVLSKIKTINPRYIFFPHWSWIIREEIWRNYECVVFHMTDLPFGRGGSPLQNLLSRGIYKTKLLWLPVQQVELAGSWLKNWIYLVQN